MERYLAVANKIGRMGRFVDVHQCGGPTSMFPVNICARTADGITIYVAQGFGRKRTDWTIDYTYNRNVTMRAKMSSVTAKTQKEMFETVRQILDGYFRAQDRNLPRLRVYDEDVRKVMDAIVLDDSYESEEYNTVTYYFSAPATLVASVFPEAEESTISVEIPMGEDSSTASTEISPMRDGEDYDWTDVQLSDATVAELLRKVAV